MRTAEDFNSFYSSPDPWQARRAGYRDRILTKLLAGTVRGQKVLELGCGEGHLTEVVFAGAKHIIGIDISDVAIQRAAARNLSNAHFERADFLETSFAGFDVIVAIECIYYLSPAEQDAFFAKVAREHDGKTLILSGPIVGENEHRRYFTETELTKQFAAHRMTVKSCHNLRVARRGMLSTFVDWVARLAPVILPLVPNSFVFQRCYMIRMM